MWRNMRSCKHSTKNTLHQTVTIPDYSEKPRLPNLEVYVGSRGMKLDDPEIATIHNLSEHMQYLQIFAVYFNIKKRC